MFYKDTFTGNMMQNVFPEKKTKVRRQQRPLRIDFRHYTPIVAGKWFLDPRRKFSKFKGKVDAKSFLTSLGDVNQYRKLTWERYLKAQISETDPLSKLFIIVTKALPGHQDDERSAVGIDLEYHKDVFYNANLELKDGPNGGAPFYSLKGHWSDISGEEITKFIRSLWNGAVGFLVPNDSPVRVIENGEHPNVLYLGMIFSYVVHCLNSSPEIQKGRKSRADELKQLGISRDNIIPMTDFFIEWLARKAPVQVSWADRGADCILMLAMSFKSLKQVLNTEKDTALWPELDNDMQSVARDVRAQLKNAPIDKRFKTKQQIWKFVGSHTKQNYRDFQSLYQPEWFMEHILKPALEQLFEIRDKRGNLIPNPNEDNVRQLDELIKYLLARGHQNKEDIEKFYPQYTEKWRSMNELFTTCKTEFDGARKEAVDLFLGREKNYSTPMSDTDKERMIRRFAEQKIDRIKKDFYIPPRLERKISNDRYPTLYYEKYAESFSDFMMEQESPTTILEPTLLMHFRTLMISKEDILRPQGEDSAYFMNLLARK